MKIKQTDVALEMKEALSLYSEEVNENRALPSIEDGLKPSGRFLLYCLYKNKFSSKKAHTKSANAIGLTMASYYAHGDQALGGVLANLSMGWKHNVPLIDFHGQLGTPDNPTKGTASPRYTECRLSPTAEVLIGDINNELPEECWEDNYLQTEKVPKYFPGNFPNLLVNENIGLGWACAANWLPHSPEAVANVIKNYADTGELTSLVPSFPGGGVLLNGADLPNIYKTGKGTVYLQAVYSVTGSTIKVTELPYKVGPNKIIQQIEDAKEKKLEWALNIVEAYNNSTLGKTEVIIKQKILDVESLLKNTSLQTTVSVNMTALVNGKPKLCSLEYVVDYYVAAQHKRIRFKAGVAVQDAEEKIHLLEGLTKILLDIDKAIFIIKNSVTTAAAKLELQNEFGITDVQATYILGIKLSQFTKKGRDEIAEEIKLLEVTIADNKDIRDNVQRRKGIIIEELGRLPKSPNKTKIEMASMSQEDPDQPRTLPFILNGAEEAIVVTEEDGFWKAYRFTAKNQLKCPAEILWAERAENVIDKVIKIKDKQIDRELLLWTAKSARGARLK